MGVLDSIRRRDENNRIMQVFGSSAEESDEVQGINEIPLETKSLEWQDEKEIQQHPDEVNVNASIGLQKAEAAAFVYSKKALIGIYAWIWVCFFVLSFHETMLTNLTNYIFAGFSSAPQVVTSYIASTIIGGVMKLPLGKTLNLWGRAEGLLASLFVYILGIIILAACNGPNAYCAGYIFYWIGYDCLYLTLQIFVADTTGLRNRAWAFAFVSTPFIATAFTAPLAVTSFINTSGWRWAFGVFAIVQPFVFAPLAFTFKYYEKQAVKKGILSRERSGRSVGQSIVHYLHEFDVIGALIIMAAFILFLLPFSITSFGESQYSSPTFIAMIVVGVCLFPVFAIWEKWFARTHFIRWELFQNRSIAGACFLAAVVFFSFDLWNTYFQNFLLVVYNLDYTMAGYLMSTFNVGSCFWSVVVGIYVYKTKHFKYLCLFFGLPLMILGSGLMIYFRGSEHGIGYVVMCQIFIAFAGGTLVIGEDMAVMAGGDREGIPMALALISLFSSVGSSIGYAVCAAIVNNVWLPAIRSRLPADMKSQAEAIYLGGVTKQQGFALGSPEREAAAYAWSWSQRQNCIASTCILILGIPAIMMWKNFNVDRKQNKGTNI